MNCVTYLENSVVQKRCECVRAPLLFTVNDRSVQCELGAIYNVEHRASTMNDLYKVHGNFGKIMGDAMLLP